MPEKKESEKKVYGKCPVCGKNYPTVGKLNGADGWTAFCGYPCYFKTLPKPTQEEALEEWERLCDMWQETERNRIHTQGHLRDAALMLHDIRSHIITAGRFATNAGRLESRGRLRYLYKELQRLENLILREIDGLKL